MSTRDNSAPNVSPRKRIVRSISKMTHINMGDGVTFPPTTMPETLEDYLTASRSVVMPISSLSAMYFVYGLYTALFTIYIRIQRYRSKELGKRSQAKSLYLLPTITLFILTTLAITGQTIHRSIHAYFTFEAVQTKDFEALIRHLQHDPRVTTGFALNTGCAVLLNATADYILIHRYHTIWGSRKWITLPLAVASIGTNVVGIVGASMFVTGNANTAIAKNMHLQMRGHFLHGVFLIMSIIVNMMITTLTAGRIWWLYRQYHSNERVYKSVLRIVVESGFIYPIFTLVHAVVLGTAMLQTIPFELSGVSYQTAGIAPTLIVVRAQLGKTIDATQNHNVQSEINLTFSSCPPPSDWSNGNDSRMNVDGNATSA